MTVKMGQNWLKVCQALCPDEPPEIFNTEKKVLQIIEKNKGTFTTNYFRHDEYNIGVYNNQVHIHFMY